MDFFFIFKLLILESWQTQSSSSEADRSRGKLPGWLEKPVLAPTASIRTVQLPKRQRRPGPWPQCPQSISVAFNVCLQIKHTQSLSRKRNDISFHLFNKWGFSHGQNKQPYFLQNLSSVPVGPEMKQGDSWEVYTIQHLVILLCSFSIEAQQSQDQTFLPNPGLCSYCSLMVSAEKGRRAQG